MYWGLNPGPSTCSASALTLHPALALKFQMPAVSYTYLKAAVMSLACLVRVLSSGVRQLGSASSCVAQDV